MLVARGFLREADLEQALTDQKMTGGRLGEILLARGKVSRPLLDRLLARQAGVALEAEVGFGSGLRAMIEQRHLERSGVSARPIDSDSCGNNDVVRPDRRLLERRLRVDRRHEEKGRC
jgi:hypothetical protein